MKNKKRLIVYSLTFTILISGCSLQKEDKYDDIEQKVQMEQVTNITKIQDPSEELKSISKLEVSIPSNREEKKKIIKEILELDDNSIVVYDGVNAPKNDYANDLTNTEDIFAKVLEENPTIQIYYCDDNSNSQALGYKYPNVTYVEKEKDISSVIDENYSSNKVMADCIKNYNEAVLENNPSKIDSIVDNVKERFSNINKESIISGLERFSNYVSSTKVYKKGVEISSKVEEKMKPYVEKAIDKAKDLYEVSKPYIEEGKEKVSDIYNDIKPKVGSLYEKGKEKIKGLFD